MRRKTLQELTIMDGFMFGAVMMEPENCRLLLERILEIPINRVEVIREKSMIYHPEYKGIRMDVYAKDEKGTRFDVEVQIRKTPVEKRSRYYHAQMDMESLQSGMEYEKLPDSYVIFICGYDPFGKDKYRYTVESRCLECPDIDCQDGLHTIILNNRGTNPEEIPKELVSFLEYTRKTIPDSEVEDEDVYIRQLQSSIRRIKDSREMGERYMTLQEMLKEEREEGRKEGWKEGLTEGRELERMELMVRLVREEGITEEKGAEILEISVEEFREKLNRHSENRDVN